MEKMVAELKQVFSFKEDTVEGDIVVIAMEESRMMVYALVTSIVRDPAKRDEWWRVGMRILTVPPRETAWTLRVEQFTGREIFTMGGNKRFIKAVDFGESETRKTTPPKDAAKGKPVLKVVK